MFQGEEGFALRHLVAVVIVIAILAAVAVVASSCSKGKPSEQETAMTPASEKAAQTVEGEEQATEEAKETPEVHEEAKEQHEEAAEGEHSEAAEEGEAGHEEVGEAATGAELPQETLEGKEVELTEANFDDIVGKKGVVALVDFWAEWCGPCLTQAPIVEELAKEYKGKVVVGKVNIDANGKLADRFGIEAIPTLIVFKDGKEVDRVVGLHEKSDLESMIEKALGG